MRVQYVITRGILGGAMVHVISLMAGLRPDVEPCLIVGEDDYLADAARDLGATVTVVPELLPHLSPIRDVQAFRAIRTAIRDFQPDLVHAHSFKAGLLGRAAARLEHVPAIFSAHGWSCADEIPNPRRSIAWAAERSVRPLSDRVIVPAEVHRQLAIRRHLARPDDVVVVRYGIDDVELPSRAERSGDEVVAVMVARFEAPKDHALVVRAMVSLPKSVRLQLVGEGPNRAAVEDEARALGVADRVDFLGLRDDVPEILAAADVLVLASRWEGQGLTILEAMRAGLPVVASDVGGVGEAVVDGETGLLVPSGDVAAFADRLGRVAADADLRSKLGAAGRKRYERSFRLESMLDATMAVYRDVLASRRRS